MQLPDAPTSRSAATDGDDTEFQRRVLGDLAIGVHGLTVAIGQRLGLYAALAAAPCSADELAARCGIHPRYAREWLDAQLSAEYVTLAPEGRCTLTPAQASALVDTDSEGFITPAFQALRALYSSEDDLVNAYESGGGVAWREHDGALDAGMGALPLPGYRTHLVDEWIPALTGVEAKLSRPGARVADVGCGVGHATYLIAAAFPNAEVIGLDYSAEAIRQAQENYPPRSVPNLTFEQVTADSFGGGPYDLVTSFNVVHDLGDPDALARQVARQLAPDGSWMVVEPNVAPDPVDNAEPAHRLFMALSSVMCLPTALSDGGPRPLGNHAGPSELREVAEAGGFAQWNQAFTSPVSVVYEARLG